MKKAYKKPVLIAKNKPTGSFAAGCGEKGQAGAGSPTCRACERSG